MRPDAFYVPLRGFDTAKARLRAGGSPGVDEIARALAEGVIAACAPVPVVVVTESAEVAEFAAGLGATARLSGATSLSEAVTLAYRAAPPGALVAVVPGDLADPAGLGDVDLADGVTVVPDRRGRGTNLLALPTGTAFAFAYGPRSAARHAAQARRLGLALTVARHARWGLDVDEPGDLTRA